MRRHRVLIHALLNMDSPSHIGSGRDDDSFTDQPVIRSLAGFPFLPGGSLAGNLFDTMELNEAQRRDWFGQTIEKEDKPKSSRLIVDDAFPVLAQRKKLSKPVELRSLNALLRDSLTVRRGASFNMEVLPRGTLFCFGCRCDLDSESDVQSLIGQIRSFLAKGGQIGGKETSGLGCWTSQNMWSRTLDMHKEKDLISWLENLHGLDWQGDEEELRRSGFTCEHLKPSASDDGWSIRLSVTLNKGLHLSSGSSGMPKKGEADLQQARQLQIDQNGQFTKTELDFGSTVKGRLRSAMEFLLRTYLIKFTACTSSAATNIIPLDPSSISPVEDINTFFGFANDQTRTGGKSGWKVKEAPWQNSRQRSEDHIRLSEFTQSVMQGAKFDFHPISHGEAVLHVTIPNPSAAEDWQKVLLYRAAELLALNVLPWGGHASRGYLGTQIRIEDHDELPDSPEEKLRLTVTNIAEEYMAKPSAAPQE